ncbi:hypothetical protein BDZ97DRAFT_1756983 [Flammula alnicola]|nr:hypothetical protein BDZ97DRAFT_1756983 [Flammula alnicola]
MATPPAMSLPLWTWRREEQTLKLKVNYLTARLRFALDACTAPIAPFLADSGIRSELEILVQYHGFASILGLSLPPPYFLQELILSSFWFKDDNLDRKMKSMARVIRGLFSDTDPDVDRSLVDQADPTGEFNWWNNGKMPTRLDVEVLCERIIKKIQFIEDGLMPASGSISDLTTLPSLLDPGLPTRRLHQILTNPHPVLSGLYFEAKDKPDYLDIGRERLRGTPSLSEAISAASYDLSTAAPGLPAKYRPSDIDLPPESRKILQIPRETLLPLLSELNDVSQLVHSQLCKNEESISRSTSSLAAYDWLHTRARTSGTYPFPPPDPLSPPRARYTQNLPAANVADGRQPREKQTGAVAPADSQPVAPGSRQGTEMLPPESKDSTTTSFLRTPGSQISNSSAASPSPHSKALSLAQESATLLCGATPTPGSATVDVNGLLTCESSKAELASMGEEMDLHPDVLIAAESGPSPPTPPITASRTVSDVTSSAVIPSQAPDISVTEDMDIDMATSANGLGILLETSTIDNPPTSDEESFSSTSINLGQASICELGKKQSGTLFEIGNQIAIFAVDIDSLCPFLLLFVPVLVRRPPRFDVEAR